ncbi:hypothetical protein K3X19_15040, partial [Listeria monocytogenes]|nr:hypothetical protein [Listeria monocytogenes]
RTLRMVNRSLRVHFRNLKTAVIGPDLSHRRNLVKGLLRAPLVLVAHPSVPAKNVKELLAHIQSKKGQFSYAAAGNGTP